MTLSISGQRLTIVTDKDEEHLHRLTDYVDEIIDGLRGGSRSASPQKIFLLAALNMADELFQAQDRNADLKEEIQRRTEHMIRILDGGEVDGHS